MNILIIIGIVWLAGAIITGLAITYNWRGLRTLVLNEVPEGSVGPWFWLPVWRGFCSRPYGFLHG